MSLLKKNERMSLLKTSAKRECNKAVSAKQPTYAWVAEKNALHGGRYQEVKDCGILSATVGALALLKPTNWFEVQGNKVAVPDSVEGLVDLNGDGVIDATEAQRLMGSGSQVVTEDFWRAPEPADLAKDGDGREWELPGPDEPEYFGGERYDGKTFSEALPDKFPSEFDVPEQVRGVEDNDEDSEEEEEEEEENEPIEEGEVWEDAQSPPPKTPPPKSPGLLLISTTLKPSALLYKHLRF